MSRSGDGAQTIQGKMNLIQLTNTLTNEAGRPVFDKTDLMGTYEIDLSFLGDLPAGSDAGRPQAADTPIATLFEAVQQTLGLKLEPKKLPVDVVVVDGGVNKVPTEN